MFRIILRLLIAVGAIFFLLVGLVVAFWSYDEYRSSGTLPNGIAYTRHTMETTRPLSLADGRKHWKGFAFPDSATNIQMGCYHQWVAAIEVVRFEAPVEDCLATAREILQQNPRGNGKGELTDALHPNWLLETVNTFPTSGSIWNVEFCIFTGASKAMWPRLLLLGFLLVNWCWVTDRSLYCFTATRLGLFGYFTINDVGQYEIHWPQFHLTVFASLIIVLGAKHCPVVVQRFLRPIHPADPAD